MAFVIADRVRETTESTGTGVLILDGAPEGFQRFTDGIGSGNTCPYTIVDLRTGDWESGRGTFQVGAQNHTLQRDTVTDSSNLGSKVDFESGEKEVFSNFISDIAIVSGAQIDMEDDVKFALGDDEDYWFVYDSSGTQFRLRSTDTDGGGADGDIFTVQDGGDVLDFSSAPTVGGTAVSLVGHSHAASDVTSGTFADARLSANVALLDAVQTFTAAQTISSTLQVGGTSSVPADSVIQAEAGGSVVMYLKGGTASKATIAFADGLDSNAGLIQYDLGSDYMVFRTAGSEKARITSGGDIIIGTDPGGSELLRVGGRGMFADRVSVSGPDAAGGENRSDSTVLLDGGGSMELRIWVDETNTEVGLEALEAGVTFGRDIVLNRNQGGVVIGTDPGGTETLRVGGSIKSKNSIFAMGGDNDDTFTGAGQLALKASSDAPFLSYHTQLGARIGYLQMQAAGPARLNVGIAQDLELRTNDTARMTIGSGGNVGIGTSSPSSPLEVNGAIQWGSGAAITSSDDVLQAATDAWVSALVDSPNGTPPVSNLEDGESVEITILVPNGETLKVYRWGAYRVSDGTAPTGLDVELLDGSDTVQDTANTTDNESTDYSSPVVSHANSSGSDQIFKLRVANDTGSTEECGGHFAYIVD